MHHECQYGAGIALTEPQPSGIDHQDDDSFQTPTALLSIGAEAQDVFIGKQHDQEERCADNSKSEIQSLVRARV